MATKTPVSVLGEITVNYQTQPVYTLIQDTMGPTGPCFKFKADLNILGRRIQGIGSGRSKKEAKHSAAKHVLEIIENEFSIKTPENCVITAPLIDLSGEAPTADPEVVSTQNTVGELQNICQTRQLPMPQYDLVAMDGPPHARIFKMQCSVSKIIKTADSYSKKLAKQKVAGVMVEHLKKEDIHIPDLMDSTAEVLEKILNTRMKSVSMSKGSAYKDPFKEMNDTVRMAALAALEETGDSIKILESVFRIMNLTFSITKQNTERDKTLYYIHINNLPELVFCDYSIAAVCASTTEALKILLRS